MATPLASELLRELLRYEPETGQLFWRARDRRHFSSDASCLMWNGRWAEKEAFTATDGKGYRCGAILSRLYRAHRVVWALVHGDTDLHIDHINGDPTDNRIDNLRAVSRVENMRNMKRRSPRRQAEMGVRRIPDGHSWVAYIGTEGRRVYLGSFPTKEEALAVRKAEEVRLGFHPNHGAKP